MVCYHYNYPVSETFSKITMVCYHKYYLVSEINSDIKQTSLQVHSIKHCYYRIPVKKIQDKTKFIKNITIINVSKKLL